MPTSFLSNTFGLFQDEYTSLGNQLTQQNMHQQQDAQMQYLQQQSANLQRMYSNQYQQIVESMTRAAEQMIVFGSATIKVEQTPKQPRVKRNLPEWF